MKKKKKKKSKVNYIERNKRLDEAFDAILDLLESFCEKYLNDEYREFCEDMTRVIYDMGAPIDKGRPQSWASGIVHALGMVNFLNDPSFSPYMEPSQIAEEFGVSQSTMQSKSREIRDELDIIPMDPRWCLESMLADNPLIWMLEVNGLMIDIREASREVQEQAYEEGLIPFIPADGLPKKEEQNKPEGNIRIIEFPSGKRNKANSEQFTEQNDTGSTLFDKMKD